MMHLQQQILNQLQASQNKNLFSTSASLHFDEKLLASIRTAKLTKPAETDTLLHFCTQNTLREFARVNQYFTFPTEAREALYNVYSQLHQNICHEQESPASLATQHHDHIKSWLLKFNPFAEKMYYDKDEILTPVACSNYSATLQLALLHVDIKTLKTPVMDIGCGQGGILVHHLRNSGINAYGFDRFVVPAPGIEERDWLHVSYGVNHWGTILSNVSFSNHFRHHHYRVDGDFEIYARVYMSILASLQIGGSFHYAPSLPFIETYLDSSQFTVTVHKIRGYSFNATVVCRIA